ncbi:unnamed protein product [Sphagnum jensenii]|uniref:Uncharacterized protein n=1 Tax=Sphagnum jensenii TaxID=128206 RepID=A0ABP1BEB1_9BRYO
MSMSQDTFPRDVQTSVHNMVSMAPVPSEVLTYTYEANSNSVASAPLDPASSFLNHMMLEVAGFWHTTCAVCVLEQF